MGQGCIITEGACINLLHAIPDIHRPQIITVCKCTIPNLLYFTVNIDFHNIVIVGKGLFSDDLYIIRNRHDFRRA